MSIAVVRTSPDAIDGLRRLARAPLAPLDEQPDETCHLLAVVARHLAGLAVPSNASGSCRALLWASVRWGRLLAEEGGGETERERGLGVARLLVHELLGADGEPAPVRARVAWLLGLARRASRLGANSGMLMRAGAWDSALQSLLRECELPKVTPREERARTRAR